MSNDNHTPEKIADSIKDSHTVSEIFGRLNCISNKFKVVRENARKLLDEGYSAEEIKLYLKTGEVVKFQKQEVQQPSTTESKIKPTVFAVGDIIHLKALGHYGIVYKTSKKEGVWAVMITSKSSEYTVEKINSRFEIGYYSKTITTIPETSVVSYRGSLTLNEIKQLRRVAKTILSNANV